MALFTIADLHLSLGCDKPMDIFKGWEGYVNRLLENWPALVGENDTVILPGDTSWAMKLEHCAEDFAFIHHLPGKKLLLKGNHDYWWNTVSKMQAWLDEKGFDSIGFIYNNSVLAEGLALCGSRGWMTEPDEAHDVKVMARETIRLKMSLDHADANWPTAEKVVFLHYPPVTQDVAAEDIVALLHAYGVRRCYYGHLHGAAIHRAVQGVRDGVEYRLISADALGFTPVCVSA